MRIALVRTYQPQLMDDIAQPLGIMALDAYLRTKGYDDIHLFDMRLAKEKPAQVLDRVLALRPDVIGLSSLTIEKDAIHELTGLIKARAPHVATVIGGPYGTSSKHTVMRDPTVDFVVVGEGEVTFHALLEALRGGDVSQVLGILYRDNGEVRETPPRPYVQDLDELPTPSWDRIDMEAYQRVGSTDTLTSDRWVVFDTSRGCPFKCTYCHDVFGKKFRGRSAKRVVEDMELLITRYRIKTFFFYDDIFNFDKARVIEICQLIQEKGWKINMQFPNGLRADIMTLEVLRALKDAGTKSVNYAIESASARIQKSVRKHLRIDKVRKLIEDTDRMGILVHGFFMLGFPGETRKEVLQTVNWACTSKLHTAGFYLVCPFEGTPLADAYVQPAKELHGTDWQYYDNPHSLSEVPADELKIVQRNAYLRFYLNPRRLLRLVQLLPEKRVLFKYILVFLKIIFSGFKVHGADASSWDHGPEAIDTLISARRSMDTSEAGEAPQAEEMVILRAAAPMHGTNVVEPSVVPPAA